MEFWNQKKINQYNIESTEIFSAQYLQPNYEQEKGLSQSELKKLRKQWMKIFPKLDKVEYLKVNHLVNQEYFESICQIPNLKELSVKSSRITGFTSIKKLTKLKELDFSGSRGINGLEGLQNLKNLEYCVLDSFFGIESLDELSYLKSLKKLIIPEFYHSKVKEILPRLPELI